MDGCRRMLLVFICVILFTVIISPATHAAETPVDLSGQWMSLQYGILTFTQSGHSFTANWAGQTAKGTISGNSGTFTYWSGPSYAASSNESKGSGSITVTGNGNMLQGSWSNASKKEPESGNFNAMRVSFITDSVSESIIGTEPGADEAKTQSETEETNAAVREGGTTVQESVDPERGTDGYPASFNRTTLTVNVFTVFTNIVSFYENFIVEPSSLIANLRESIPASSPDQGEKPDASSESLESFSKHLNESYKMLSDMVERVTDNIYSAIRNLRW